MKARPDNIRMVAEGLDHPEGLNFGRDGVLWAGGEEGQMYRIDADSGAVTETVRTGGLHLGIALDSVNTAYVCDCRSAAVHEITADGAHRVITRGTAERAMQVPNYCVFDRDGNLYISDSGDYWNPEGTGCIYLLTPDGDTSIYHAGPFQFPNGLAIDPDGEHLYIIQSTAPNIVRIPVSSRGPLSDAPELVLNMENCVPDGLAFDDRGGLYIACYKPDTIYYLTPEGDLTVAVEDPTGELLARPTNVALRDGELFFANLGGWHIGSIKVDAKPAPLNHPPPRNSSK